MATTHVNETTHHMLERISTSISRTIKINFERENRIKAEMQRDRKLRDQPKTAHLTTASAMMYNRINF